MFLQPLCGYWIQQKKSVAGHYLIQAFKIISIKLLTGMKTEKEMGGDSSRRDERQQMTQEKPALFPSYSFVWRLLTSSGIRRPLCSHTPAAISVLNSQPHH